MNDAPSETPTSSRFNVGGFLRQGLKRRISERPFADAWMDLSDVTRSQRWLAIAGYVVIGLIIVLMLVVEQMTRALGPDSRGSDTLVTLAQRGSFIFGWAFLLAGAAQSRRRILLPVLAIFGLTTIGASLGAFGLLPCLTIVAVFGLSVAAGRIPALRDNREWVTALSFLIPFVTTALFTLAGSQFGSSLGQALTGFWMYPILLAIWALSGITIVDTAADLAKWVNEKLAQLLAPTPLYAAIILTIFVRLTIAIWGVFAIAVLFGSALDGSVEMDNTQLALISVIGVEMLVGIPILLWMGVLALTRRWQPRSVFLAFATSLILPIVILGLILSLGGTDISDLIGTGIERAGLIPPVLLFVFFLTVSLLSLGSSFAGGDSAIFPRSARIYLSLGLVLLLLNFVFNSVNLDLAGGDDVSLATLQDSLFPLSLLVLGLPYFLFMLFRRQEKLVGDAPAHVKATSRWPALDRVQPRQLIGGVLVGGLLMTGVSCLIAELLGSMLGVN